MNPEQEPHLLEQEEVSDSEEAGLNELEQSGNIAGPSTRQKRPHQGTLKDTLGIIHDEMNDEMFTNAKRVADYEEDDFFNFSRVNRRIFDFATVGRAEKTTETNSNGQKTLVAYHCRAFEDDFYNATKLEE